MEMGWSRVLQREDGMVHGEARDLDWVGVIMFVQKIDDAGRNRSVVNKWENGRSWELGVDE